jgi:hypothetical protein
MTFSISTTAGSISEVHNVMKKIGFCFLSFITLATDHDGRYSRSVALMTISAFFRPDPSSKERFAQ